MNARHPRSAPPQSARAGAPSTAPIFRGPAAHSVRSGPPPHAPNAALLIDFDNVTMGIRSDLQTELRNLLSSDIVKGKVAVQRAYADWRRYPQYILPLTESSIDLIFAPAYGSSKKNATDIRLAIDAMELVFTRPEIGTIILLSGDSDFSSLVIKLKEYGKYVIGVGIRESSSDLLVMNCDEYYSYNALAGLVKTSEEDAQAQKRDPWELVGDAIRRMKRNGDVMRSDRLKQVMQEIDPSFDEKDLGMSKFSRFVQEAATRGLVTVTRLENGQLEVTPPDEAGRADAAAAPRGDRPAERAPDRGADRAPREDRDGERGDRDERGRRRGRGRGRGRERDLERETRDGPAEPRVSPDEALQLPVAAEPGREPRAESPRPGAERQAGQASPRAARPPREEVGLAGERLTRSEAFDLVRRATEALVTGEEAARASDVRRRAREILGRDSESLSERNFTRILKDAHDADVVDLRRRGDDFEVGISGAAVPVAEQLTRAEAAATPASVPAIGGTPRTSLRGRGGGRGGRGGELPPELLALGVVAPFAIAPSTPMVTTPVLPPAPPAPRGDVLPDAPDVTESAEVSAAPARGRGAAKKSAAKKSAAKKSAAKKGAAKKAAAKSAPDAGGGGDAAPAARRPRARKTARGAAE